MAGLFIKLDVDFWDHPKVVTAGVMAGVLYQRMSMYCMQHTTDGFVPAAQLPRFALPATNKLTAALAAVGLIEPADGGWLVPGYVERYRTAVEVDELKAKRADAGRKGGRPRKPFAKQDESNLVSGGFHGEKANGNPEVEVEVEVEVENHHPPDPTHGSVDPADAVAVAVADSLIAALGYVPTEPAGPDERRYVARALGRGWTPQLLTDLAVEASARLDVDDPRRYLLGALKVRANSDPPPIASGPHKDPRFDRSAETTAAIAAATYVPYTDPATGASW